MCIYDLDTICGRFEVNRTILTRFIQFFCILINDLNTICERFPYHLFSNIQVSYKEITIFTRFMSHDLRPHLHTNFIGFKSFRNRMILTRCKTRFKPSFFCLGI